MGGVLPVESFGEHSFQGHTCFRQIQANPELLQNIANACGSQEMVLLILIAPGNIGTERLRGESTQGLFHRPPTGWRSQVYSIKEELEDRSIQYPSYYLQVRGTTFLSVSPATNATPLL